MKKGDRFRCRLFQGWPVAVVEEVVSMGEREYYWARLEYGTSRFTCFPEDMLPVEEG